METYLIGVIEDLVATAVLIGVAASYLRASSGRKGTRMLGAGIALGLVAAAVMAFMKQNTSLVSTGDWNMLIFGASFAVAVIMLVCAIVRAILGKGESAKQSRAFKAIDVAVMGALVLFVALRVFYKVPDVINYPANFGIGTDNLISTDFAYRIVGWLGGIVLMVLVAIAIMKSFRALGSRELGAVTAVIVAVICFVQSVSWCQILIARRAIARGTALYDVMFPLTSAMSNNTVLFTLAIVVATIVLAVIVIVLSLRDADPYDSPAQHRKNRARWRNRRRWAIVAIVCLAASLLVITAVKDYVNRGPEIVEAEQVQVEDGAIRVPLDAVEDGHLHRFAYTTDPGVATETGYTTSGGVGVRFIVIKKPGATAYGVGLDACEICGETGYYERDGQVVCKLCDVVMNINTIGFKGGCNPIPFEYKVEDGYLVIDPAELSQFEKTFKS